MQQRREQKMRNAASEFTERIEKARGILLTALLVLALLVLPACSGDEAPATGSAEAPASQEQPAQAMEDPEEPGAPEPAPSDGGQLAEPVVFDLSQVPAYDGSPYAAINDNVPTIGEDDIPAQSESYAPLDELGRCGAAVAVVSPSTMPAEGEERGSIGMVKPTGWHTVRYDDLVDGRYLYNRCHLIGWQLTAENDNERNLVTGTRYMNTEGMLPFENEVVDYVDRTGGRVLLRVEPVFEGDELVCRGVHMETRSLDDGGLGVAFNVFCYNVQPGVGIDYATGESWREEAPTAQAPEAAPAAQEMTYVLNTNTDKFHYPECDSVDRMSEENKQIVTATRDELIAQGYDPCGNCNP
ncbi:DNA/RNA non-specific endonuclease [uncultured Enorma sp.]|uniref:DNA/RNA non-specific endonuclease n=1 Tax=uncultured Enorma sp. TaxID=1714346 RepID=UPI00260D3B63|nr:DNA/RNA non-specific endonuclease [uncultured Enorma sp.]